MEKCRYDNICGRDALEGHGGRCILHSENDNKDKDEFEEALSEHWERHGPNFSMVVFPKGLFNFSGKTFEKEASFENATFRGDALFRKATFECDVNFQGAIFPQEVRFKKVTFDGFAYFADADFTLRADFTDAQFRGGANFSEAVFEEDSDFTDTDFEGNARFYDTQFKGSAKLPDATFGKDADFSEATFTGKANFVNVEFGSRVRFYDTDFKSDANFYSTTFAGDVDFTKTGFESNANFMSVEFKSAVDFPMTTFTSNANFENARFESITRFKGSTFKGDSYFENAVFQEKAVFIGKSERDRIFQGATVTFISVTYSKNASLHFRYADLTQCHFLRTELREIDFTDVKWRRIKGRNSVYDEQSLPKGMKERSPQEVERLYRQLKKNYEDRGDFPRAGDFHIGEKEARRQSTTSCTMWCLLTAYRALSKYGERAMPALCWLVCLILSCAIGYYLLLEAVPIDPHTPVSWVDALLLSAEATFFPFRSLGLDGAAVQSLNLIQRLFSPPLLALLALAIRQRVKR